MNQTYVCNIKIRVPIENVTLVENQNYYGRILYHDELQKQFWISPFALKMLETVKALFRENIPNLRDIYAPFFKKIVARERPLKLFSK